MRIYPHSFAPISFHFSQTPRDFIVNEVPLYEFSQTGEHLIVQIRKKGLSTQEMIKILSSLLGCKSKEIGYAGLKDKNALTTQYISLPYSLQKKLLTSKTTLEEHCIKILSTFQHCNKIRIGHLKGNSFFIRLKKVSPQDFKKLETILQQISLEGIPNYFGYQRFGKTGDNYLEGKKLINFELKIRDKKLAQFLISSYQSYLFNQWLTQRIQFCKILQSFRGNELSSAIEEAFKLKISTQDLESLLKQPHFFKILRGDILHHYPYGKVFFADAPDMESTRFFRQSIVPCGILSGTKIKPPLGLAFDFQKDFLDSQIKEAGNYRFAWVFPQNLTYRYIQEKAHLELSFFLPKGSYATTLIEALQNQELKDK